jgi:diadenosine tetraphosphate (Ap4A) HIT family hydrolase
MNATAEKFGYPASLLREFDRWSVLLRPAQVTLGSLVLVCHESVSHFGEISAAASTELGEAVAAIESALGEAFAFDRINYLMLMMVDPDVHFHVLPRYETERVFAEKAYHDRAWPGPPDITANLGFDTADQAALLDHLRGFF